MHLCFSISLLDIRMSASRKQKRNNNINCQQIKIFIKTLNILWQTLEIGL